MEPTSGAMKSATPRGFSGAGVWEGGSAAAMVQMNELEKRLDCSSASWRGDRVISLGLGLGLKATLGLLVRPAQTGMTGMSRGGRD
jgi:hypothetical protein